MLRRLCAADLAAFQAYRQDPEVGRFQDWERMDDAKAIGFLAHMESAELFVRGQWSQIGIDLGGVLIGDMGIFVNADKPEAEMGVTLANFKCNAGFGHRVAFLVVLRGNLSPNADARASDQLFSCGNCSTCES